MKNFKLKPIALMAMTSGMMIALSFTAMANGNTTTSHFWYQDTTEHWHICRDIAHTDIITNSWVCDDAENANRDDNWYLINQYGNMYEYIVQDENGNYYLLNPNHDGTFGKMISDSGFTYNGVTFILDQDHNGTFGKILNVEAVQASGLPVTQVNLGGKPFLYTSEFSSRSNAQQNNTQPNSQQINTQQNNANESTQQTRTNMREIYCDEVVELVNIERQKAGLAPLRHDPELDAAAMARASEIIQNFDHTRPDGSPWYTMLQEYGISYHAAAENIAAGHDSPKAVVNGWMNSPGHRANILHPSLSAIGVGLVTGGKYYTNWAQLFTG